MRTSFVFVVTFFLFFLHQVSPVEQCAAKIYKYKDGEGKWSFTNDPSLVPDLNKAEERDSVKAVKRDDLHEKLSRVFPPRNKVEEARNATVAIQTSFGMGSGFFVSADGYILTNRHVLMGDEAELRKVEERLKEEKDRLLKEAEAISRERDRLQKVKDFLDSRGKSAPEELRSLYLMDKRNLESYSARHEKRKKEFEERLRDFDDLKSRMQNPYDNEIILIDKTELSVSVVSISYTYDLALLRLYGYRCPHLEPALTPLEHGAPLYAIGSPLKLMHSVTSGIFSGIREFSQQRYIQTNAQISPGNSGGPIITKEGKVIGISTFKFVGPHVEGIGFAIPIDVALKEFERYLGKVLESK